MYRLTAVLPCFGRPERTKRIIQNVLSQTIDGWEVFIIGDGCPNFQKLIDEGYDKSAQFEICREKGNKIHFYNLETNHGAHGYYIMNQVIQLARGKYFVWLANDDTILPTHFENYLEIEKTDYDYMYFDSYIEPTHEARISQLAPSCIGHSEIIVKTELAKRLKPHSPHYGHDWDFITEMASIGKGIKASSINQTYRVMRVPNLGCADTID